MKLKKVNEKLYCTDDLRFTMKKEFKSFNGKIHRVWRLYKDGNYIAMLSSVSEAQEVVKICYAEEKENEVHS